MADESKDLAGFMLAIQRLDNMRAYFQRGRQFETATDDFLDQELLIEMKKWAASGTEWGSLTRLDDIVAEAEFRAHRLPTDRARPYFDAINETIDKAPENPARTGTASYIGEWRAKYAKTRAQRN